MSEVRITTDSIREAVAALKAGDRVLLSGTIYTARDAAHKRLTAAIQEGQALPFWFSDAVVYYTGPTPAKNGLAVGSAGPTTSGRMDIYTPLLLDNGLCAMIGKGERNRQVIASIVKNGCVYFCAIGGAGALYSRCITSCEVIAYPELGCESVKRLTVSDLPIVTAVDCRGGNIFDLQRNL